MKLEELMLLDVDQPIQHVGCGGVVDLGCYDYREKKTGLDVIATAFICATCHRPLNAEEIEVTTKGAD